MVLQPFHLQILKINFLNESLLRNLEGYLFGFEMESGGVFTVYGNGLEITDSKKSLYVVKVSLAQILRGGVIMDIVNTEQAMIAEKLGILL